MATLLQLILPVFIFWLIWAAFCSPKRSGNISSSGSDNSSLGGCDDHHGGSSCDGGDGGGGD